MQQMTMTGGMPDAGGEEAAECHAVVEVLDLIGDKWMVMVVGALSRGTTRFNALMRAIDGISHRMLTIRLRDLERDGFVTRTVYPTIPPKVEYRLTEMGGSLIDPLNMLAGWAMRHRSAIRLARETFDKGERPEHRAKSLGKG